MVQRGTIGAYCGVYSPRGSGKVFSTLEHLADILQAFSVVDKTIFRALLKYQCPKMKDSDISHRTKLREEILVKAGNVENRFKEHLKVSLSSLLELC